MKLRIKGSSVRLRLSQADLRRFEKDGRIEGGLRFAGGRRFVYALVASDDTDDVTARFDGETLAVLLPASWVRSWVDSERVGFAATQRLDDGSEIHLLVEKDFQCLHKPADDEAAFPHPGAAGRA